MDKKQGTLESMVNIPYGNVYRNKKVLITGNTGFKGSWMTMWLKSLGAEVYGFSKDIPTSPSMYETLKLDELIEQEFGDIANEEIFADYFNSIRPDFVFHLAAQAIVSTSYTDPMETIRTNVIGTASVLESLKNCKHQCISVIVTSDKSYDNVEWLWGYRENDALGGKDIYSGSKGAAELVVKSYWHSFLSKKSNVAVGVARAGNVIGGGDWAKDRIVVDIVNAILSGDNINLRSPNATRPWQHVLEPLSGYLLLGQHLKESAALDGESFNFGPKAETLKTVLDLSKDILDQFDNDDTIITNDGNVSFDEAKLLKLNCDKALAKLGWNATLTYNECVKFITDWYIGYSKNEDLLALTFEQIENYQLKAQKRWLKWSK